jgi:putative ABC transport system permease protein/lipoprotein-releasing system permease protein
MNPLATRTYLLRNAGKTLPLIGVIVLAVMLICAIVTLINSIPLSVRTIYKYSSVMMGVTPRGDISMTPKIRETIERESPVEIGRISVCRASDTEVKSIVGKWQFGVIALGSDDQKFLLDRLGSTAINGRLPKPGEAEAVISEPVSRNLKLKLGDQLLGPDNADAFSPESVKIVGIAKTEQWIMVSDLDYYRANHFPPIDLLLVFAKNVNEQSRLDDWALKRFKGERARILAYGEVEKSSNEMFKTLYQILNVVIGMLVIVITIMMGMLINIYSNQRTQEFALLQALGYTQAMLIRRIAGETAVTVIGGWLLGVGVAYGILVLVDKVLMYPNAFAIDIADKSALNYTVPVPLAILLTATITLWNRFRTFDPVAVVERRLV